MALSLQVQTNIARTLATLVFPTGTTAHASHADLLTAVQGIDSALDLTLTAAAGAVGGSTTIINGLAMSVTAPAVGSWSNPEKALILAAVVEGRAGLLT